MAEYNNNKYLSKRSFCILTGASKGLGEGIGRKLAEVVGDGSVLLFTARSTQQLENLKKHVEEKRPRVQVVTVKQDMFTATADDYRRMIESALAQTTRAAGDFDGAVVVHNCATADVHMNGKRLVEQDNALELREFLGGNVASMMVLTSVFVKCFDRVPNKLVVNISSLAAHFPIMQHGVYSAAKAGRDMYLKSLVFEEPSIRALSYGPGLVKTNMADAFRRESYDPEFRKMLDEAFDGRHKVVNAISIEKAADIMVSTVMADKFKNAEHVDGCPIGYGEDQLNQ